MAKILVADDNSNIQKMVGLALKDQGIDVVAVGNGEAAVRKISDIIPDLVLADVFMPVRNGYEVCQYVKQDPALAHIPVILLVLAASPNSTFRITSGTVHFTRGILAAVGSICGYAAIAELPLGDATALFFMAPLFVTAGAVFVLREKSGIFTSTTVASDDSMETTIMRILWPDGLA